MLWPLAEAGARGEQHVGVGVAECRGRPGGNPRERVWDFVGVISMWGSWALETLRLHFEKEKNRAVNGSFYELNRVP